MGTNGSIISFFLKCYKPYESANAPPINSVQSIYDTKVFPKNVNKFK